jgi:hypothetical protein
MSTISYLYRRLNELEDQFIESDWFEAESIQLEIDNVQRELREIQQATLEEPFKTFAIRGFSDPLQGTTK